MSDGGTAISEPQRGEVAVSERGMATDAPNDALRAPMTLWTRRRRRGLRGWSSRHLRWLRSQLFLELLDGR